MNFTQLVKRITEIETENHDLAIKQSSIRLELVKRDPIDAKRTNALTIELESIKKKWRDNIDELVKLQAVMIPLRERQAEEYDSYMEGIKE